MIITISIALLCVSIVTRVCLFVCRRSVLTRDDTDCGNHDVANDVIDRPLLQHGFIASTSGRISANRGVVGVGLVATTGGQDVDCARWMLSVPAGQRIRLSLVRLLSRQQQHW